jgi:hypothetical protein
MFKLLTTILLTIIAAISCTAQDATHFTLWSRLRVIKTFSPKWEAEIDMQYRRQDNDNLNIMALPLAQSGRLWVYHHPIPRWTIGFSPFTWFHNNQLVVKPTDISKEWNEYRVSLYGEYRVSVTRKLILLNRLGAEPILQIRTWGNRNFVRLRWREQINFQIQPATQLFIGGELFANSASSEKMNFYNQSRGFAGILYHLSAKFEATTNYMFQHIDMPSASTKIKSHNLQVGANIHL